MTLSTTWRRPLWMAAAGMLLFTAARLGLLLTHWHDFANLSAGALMGTFIEGLRFDASILVRGIGFPLLFLLLPFRWAHGRAWQGFWSWFIFAELAVFAFVLIADTLYFGVVHRHIGPEVATISGDPALMVDIVLTDYWWALLSFALLVAVGAILWRRGFRQLPSAPSRRTPRLVVLVVLLAVFVFIGRGGLQYKPLNITMAFANGQVSAGYLTLNGPFSMVHSAMSSQPRKVDFYPFAEAVAETRRLYFDDNETPVDPDYPLLRHHPGDAAKRRPNVVVFMLESWDALQVDAIRRAYGKKPLGATPNFDALADRGTLFTNFFAAGQRSMNGMAALLAAIPTLPGMPYIGKGLAQNDLSLMGHLAKSQGYQTIFLQSSARGSFHVDAIAARAGFDTYQGAEDIPSAHEDVVQESPWGVWDHSTFQQAHRLFAAADKPFLGFIFNSSTHQPWHIPGDRWRQHPGDDKISRYLNSLGYVDWAIGQFMDAAKKAGYYDNTIFVFTADHVSHLLAEPSQRKTMYHIPGLIVGPGVPAKVDSRYASQLDVLPSIIDLAGWDVDHASFGRSLFHRDDDKRGVFAVNWKVLEWLQRDGWLSHNLDRRVGAHVEPGADREAMQKHLLATYQTLVTLFLENRLYRSFGAAP